MEIEHLNNCRVYACEALHLGTTYRLSSMGLMPEPLDSAIKATESAPSGCGFLNNSLRIPLLHHQHMSPAACVRNGGMWCIIPHATACNLRLGATLAPAHIWPLEAAESVAFCYGFRIQSDCGFRWTATESVACVADSAAPVLESASPSHQAGSSCSSTLRHAFYTRHRLVGRYTLPGEKGTEV